MTTTKMIAGLDEVGRGALAGPMVVAVAAFHQPVMPEELKGLKDSKQLSPKKREELAPIIVELADFFGIGWVTAADIDAKGIEPMWELACARALISAPPLDLLLVDGNRLPECYPEQAKAVVKGDQEHWQISAASVIAKVFRDREMAELDEELSGGLYDWSKNSGYGTAPHYQMIVFNGPTSLHRKSFLKKFYSRGQNYMSRGYKS